jgi:hypothetical protein
LRSIIFTGSLAKNQQLEENMKNPSDMTTDELKELLSKLKEELEEIEEEKMFVLGQTNIHLPGATVKKYEAELDELKARIGEVEKVLLARQG